MGRGSEVFGLCSRWKGEGDRGLWSVLTVKIGKGRGSRTEMPVSKFSGWGAAADARRVTAGGRKQKPHQKKVLVLVFLVVGDENCSA